MKILSENKWEEVQSMQHDLHHSKSQLNFIEQSLINRQGKCRHKKHVGLKYFGCAWHVFCYECGESRYSFVCGCYGNDYACREHRKKMAKKVEYI